MESFKFASTCLQNLKYSFKVLEKYQDWAWYRRESCHYRRKWIFYQKSCMVSVDMTRSTRDLAQPEGWLSITWLIWGISRDSGFKLSKVTCWIWSLETMPTGGRDPGSWKGSEDPGGYAMNCYKGSGTEQQKNVPQKGPRTHSLNWQGMCCWGTPAF